MAETGYSQENIAAIRTRLDNIEKMTRLLIASNPNSGAHIADVFRRRTGSASLYLELESGPKSQEELAHALGKNQSTISRILVHLYESGLIERMPNPSPARWMWHDLERVLGISRVAKRLADVESSTKAGTGQPDASDLPTD